MTIPHAIANGAPRFSRNWYDPSMMMSISWNTGVKSQATRLSGSVGVAGTSGGIGDADGTAPDPVVHAPGMQALMTRASTTKNRSAGPIRRRVGGRVTGARPS